MAASAEGLQVHGHAAAARAPGGAARDAAARERRALSRDHRRLSRSAFPGITMRSTFIVGFPGETEEHVAYLQEWIDRAELDRVGFFEYSSEEGTPGAELPGKVPARERRKRLVRLREAQRLASERARGKRVGERVRVLVEERRRLRKSDPLRSGARRARRLVRPFAG